MAKMEGNVTVSPYTIIKKTDHKNVWLVNTLYGKRERLTMKEWDSLISLNGKKNISRSLIDRLSQSRIISNTADQEKDIYNKIAESFVSKVRRFGFLLDQLEERDLTNIPPFVKSNDLCNGPDTVYYYGWFNSSVGLGNMGLMASAIKNISNNNKGSLALLTNGTQVLTDTDLFSLEKIELQKNSNTIVFYLTQEAAYRAGGLKKYIENIVTIQKQINFLGFTPVFIFLCTKDSTEFLLSQLFYSLCFSGIYPRNFHVSFSDYPDINEVICELHNWNWKIYDDNAFEIFTSPTLRVFDPLSRGLADKLRGVLRDNKGSPVVYLCPFAYQSFIFGKDGNISCCPIVFTMNKNNKPDNDFLFSGNVNSGTWLPDNIDKWESRNHLSMPKCASCRYAPLCGCGCPMDAFVQDGDIMTSPCPPYEAILTAETKMADKNKSKKYG
jgi:radical SAM protein with 4Fe4S-binding SPASM domain